MDTSTAAADDALIVAQAPDAIIFADRNGISFPARIGHRQSQRLAGMTATPGARADAVADVATLAGQEVVELGICPDTHEASHTAMLTRSFTARNGAPDHGPQETASSA